jgi:oligoribonuclease (3'-5' exoribonuclease)
VCRPALFFYFKEGMIMIYASIDIETLGLDPDYCDVIEFGCVLEDTTELKTLDKLPSFHCYLTKPRDRYQGEVYAMWMHSKSGIFERIAKRTEGYSYIPHDLLDEVFAEWLQDQGVEDKLVVAGKNFQAFDMRFLRRLGFGVKTQIHHRVLDPGSMYFDPRKDDVPPGLEECLKRAGIEKTVDHTAVEDAVDVVRCIRAKDGTLYEKVRNWCVYERLQDEDLGCVDVFDNVEEAKEYVSERRLMPLGTSSMFTIVSPEGQVTKF